MNLKPVVYDLGSSYLKKIGSTSDSVGSDGVYAKAISDFASIPGNGYTWVFNGDASGFKTIRTTGFMPYAFGQNGIMIKFDGSKMNYSDGSAANTWSVFSTTLYIAVSDSDTGWDEAWVAGTSFTGMTWPNMIKAYMNGWKMTIADANVANCVWTGIFSGEVKTGSAGYTFVIANIDAGFTPHKMVYVLQNAITSNLGYYCTFSKLTKNTSYGLYPETQ